MELLGVTTTMKPVVKVLEEVLNNPTAPFCEKWVLDYVESELVRLKIPYFKDQWQNIIAGAKSAAELRHSNKTALLAHTDHPGFHLVKKVKNREWLARWYGGAPPKIIGAQVAIHNPHLPARVIKGRVLSKKMTGPQKNEFIIRLGAPQNRKSDATASGALGDHCFGAFDFPGFSKKKTRVHTRAADDLAGVTIILATLARLNKKERRHMLGIFTRAEEVGFRGTLGLIYSRTLGPANAVISLEASRQLEGARVSKGPVIRLGDRRTLFDSHVTAQLDKAAENLRKENNKLMFQRRIMNGGTCEATAFNLHGIRASGLAIPLGNYHNQRPDGRPGAEFIDFRDVELAVALCVEYFKLSSRGENPVGDFVKKLSTDFKKDRPHLNKKMQFKKRELP